MLSKETQEWLNDLQKEGNLSPEAFAALKTATEANSKADEFIKGSVLRQSDYSRNSASLQSAKADFEKAQAELKTKEAGIAKYQTDIGQWKAGADAKIIQAQKEREEAVVKASAALSRLQRIGVQYGVDESEWKLGDDDVKVPDVKVPTFDTSQFVTRADIGKGTQEAALLDAMIYDIGEQHKELFGKRLPNATELIREALASGKPLTEYWREKFKVGERETALHEETIQGRIKQAVEDEKTKWANDHVLPGGVRPGFRDDLHGAPVLKEGGIAAPAEGGGGISAAIAAFNTGKYSSSAKR